MLIIRRPVLKQLGFVYEGVEHKAMRHAECGPTDLVCYFLEKE
jgi:ribosomal-protein-alanine N-acetyltransferase